MLLTMTSSVRDCRACFRTDMAGSRQWSCRINRSSSMLKMSQCFKILINTCKVQSGVVCTGRKHRSGHRQETLPGHGATPPQYSPFDRLKGKLNTTTNFTNLLKFIRGLLLQTNTYKRWFVLSTVALGESELTLWIRLAS